MGCRLHSGMSTPLRPSVPASKPLRDALAGSAPLAGLMQRLRESEQRYAVIQVLLPGRLADHVRMGPLDDDGWSLLADNTAVAAKLRQLVPQLQAALRSAGYADLPVRIKVNTK